jgi:hypothetical protein
MIRDNSRDKYVYRQKACVHMPKLKEEFMDFVHRPVL